MFVLCAMPAPGVVSLACRHYDSKLADRLAAEHLDFIQFAWRWVNCLLIRELPFHLSFRLVRVLLICVIAVSFP